MRTTAASDISIEDNYQRVKIHSDYVYPPPLKPSPASFRLDDSWSQSSVDAERGALRPISSEQPMWCLDWESVTVEGKNEKEKGKEQIKIRSSNR